MRQMIHRIWNSIQVQNVKPLNGKTESKAAGFRKSTKKMGSSLRKKQDPRDSTIMEKVEGQQEKQNKLVTCGESQLEKSIGSSTNVQGQLIDLDNSGTRLNSKRTSNLESCNATSDLKAALLAEKEKTTRLDAELQRFRLDKEKCLKEFRNELLAFETQTATMVRAAEKSDRYIQSLKSEKNKVLHKLHLSKEANQTAMKAKSTGSSCAPASVENDTEFNLNGSSTSPHQNSLEVHADEPKIINSLNNGNASLQEPLDRITPDGEDGKSLESSNDDAVIASDETKSELWSLQEMKRRAQENEDEVIQGAREVEEDLRGELTRYKRSYRELVHRDELVISHRNEVQVLEARIRDSEELWDSVVDVLEIDDDDLTPRET